MIHGNLGSVLRTMSAVGSKKLILVSDCTDPFSEKVIRSTMGAIFKVEIYNFSTADAIKKILKNKEIAQKFTTIAASLNGKNLYTLGNKNVDKLQENSQNIGQYIAIFGNESRGLTDELLSNIDEKITIPMQENVESLNLSTSVAIILYELFRKKNY